MSFVRQKLMRVAGGSSGSALVGVAALAIILSIGAAGLIMVVTSASRNETIALNDTRAFLAAESGLLLGAKWINSAANWTAFKGNNPNEHDRETIIEETELTVNNMKVQVELEKTTLGVLIISTAKSSGLIGYDKEVSQDATPTGLDIKPQIFDNAIICDNDLTFVGSGDIQGIPGVPTNVHSNQAIVLKGTINITKSINITSCVSISATNPVTINIDNSFAKSKDIDGNTKTLITDGGGTWVEGVVDPIAIPEIDLTPWFYEALANNEVFNGTFQTPDYTPNGGILWVNGDVKLNGGTFNGTLIATENIKLGGSASVIGPPGDDGFAIASVGGNVDHNSTGKIDGLIYCKNGDFTFGGNGILEGQVIAKGYIGMNGTTDAITYKKTIITTPDPGPDVGCLLVLGTWWEKNI